MLSECPVCKRAGLEITFNIHNIPYFEEVMETLAKCQSCGYRHADLVVLGEKEPVSHSFKIDCQEDMSVRVVRSSHSTIEVPELGVRITPGPGAEGYISNVEGVLKRIEDVIAICPDSKRSIELLRKIKMAKEGKETLHLKIEDPTGNSAIISKKALKENIE